MICIGWLNLANVSDMASIITGVSALGAWLYYLSTKRLKQNRLERYLREAKRDAADTNEKLGRKSVLNAMAYCGLTEAEVLDAAFHSKAIKTVPRTDWNTGYASGILLEYDD